MLHSQLQTEKDLYDRLEQTQRKDMLAQMLLRRINTEIKSIEDKIHGSERKKDAQCRHTKRLIQYVLEIVHRFRDNKDGRTDSLLQISLENVLQTQAGNQ